MRNYSMAKAGRPAEFPIKKLVALDQEIIDGVAAFQADETPPIENQSEAIRRIIRDWLTGHGYLATDE